MNQRPCDRLVVGIGERDLDGFEAGVKRARDMGATHVVISALRDRTDYRGENEGSPWTEWNMGFSSIFKHATPPALKDLYPAAWQKRQMAFMKAKHDIVARLGLRCAYHGLEPHWISERIYAKHPEWRGSRCDNSLRTVGMFFAPNTDHPEVREAYRDAVKMILKACPALNIFRFHTNDCGAGYPWASKLYVNPNGPTGSEGGDMGLRVAGFLKTIRDGAREAGVDAWVYTHPFMMTPDELHLLRRSLEPGIGVTSHRGDVGADPAFTLGDIGGYGNGLVEGLGTPWSIIAGVARMKTSKIRSYTASSGAKFELAFTTAMKEPPAENEQQRMQVAARIAEAMYGKETVPQVIDAWYSLKEAHTKEAAIGIPYYGVLALRWLVRPLVAHQSLLKPAERSYWEPYIYQSRESQPETYLDYLNMTGRDCVSNWAHSATICAAAYGIVGTYRAAAGHFEAAGKIAKRAGAKKELKIEALRCRAQACVLFTVHNFLEMGTLIMARDKDPKTESVDPEIVPQSNDGSMGSSGLFMMYRTLRWELDNVNELIRLMEQSPVPLIHHARDKAWEGALLYGPDILANLKKKARIMVKYWRSAEQGYYRSTKGG
ncbi:MAG TPA: hypothetical protein VMZ92_05790 [Planctomycetota bacterium]|nr:hypothetical protein [Planctomycetota bacterium]